MATHDAGTPTSHQKPTNIAKDTPHPELKQHGTKPGSFLNQQGRVAGLNKYFSARVSAKELLLTILPYMYGWHAFSLSFLQRFCRRLEKVQKVLGLLLSSG